MAVPYTFATATSAIPLSQLDSNFATPITLGNTAIQLGNTVTTLNNMTFANATISSGNVTATTVTANTVTSPAATALTIQSAGTTAMTIDTSQNVGIGTSSPSYKLDVNGSIRGDTFVRSTSGTVSSYLVANSGGGFGIVGTASNHPFLLNTNDIERMRIDTSGNVGIGIAPTGDTLLEIYGANSATIYKNVNTGTGSSDGFYVGMAKSSGTDGYVYNRESANLIFGTANTEAARIDSSGNLLVGTTTSRAKTTIKGTTSDTYANSGIALERVSVANYWNILTASTNDLYFGYNTTDKGYIRQSDGAYISLSDERVKKNISDIQYGLSEVLALRPCSYHMTEQQDEDKKTLGFIAQESLNIVPETVFEMQGGMYGMDKAAVIPVLVKAIQEQQAIITQLTERISALEGKA